MDFRGTGILDKNFDFDGFEEEREKKMEDRNEAPIYNNIYRSFFLTLTPLNSQPYDTHTHHVYEKVV